MLVVPAGDGTAEAILETPPEGTGPGVLLFMDAFGLRPRIGELARRIAAWGYVVLAPNLFYRDGDVATVAPQVDLGAPEAWAAAWPSLAPRMGRLTAAAVHRDVDAWVPALRALPGVRRGPVGVVGFCMGGRLAVRAAGRRPDEVAACVAFHTGGLVTEAEDSPHRELASARAEFLFAHADHDPSMGPEQVAALGDALAAAGLRGTNVVVPDAAHGYTMSDTAVWNEVATDWAFEKLEELLARTLAGAGGHPNEV